MLMTEAKTRGTRDETMQRRHASNTPRGPRSHLATAGLRGQWAAIVGVGGLALPMRRRAMGRSRTMGMGLTRGLHIKCSGPCGNRGVRTQTRDKTTSAVRRAACSVAALPVGFWTTQPFAQSVCRQAPAADNTTACCPALSGPSGYNLGGSSRSVCWERVRRRQASKSEQLEGCQDCMLLAGPRGSRSTILNLSHL